MKRKNYQFEMDSDESDRRIKKIISDYDIEASKFFRLLAKIAIMFDDRGIRLYKIINKIDSISKTICKDSANETE